MSTNRTGAALDRRALLHRAIAGAAGAAIGATAALPAAKAAPGNDAELFALLAEEERLWTATSRLQDEAQRREQSLPWIKVEIGRNNGAPIYVSREEHFNRWFAIDPESAAAIDNRIGRAVVSMLRKQEADRSAKLHSLGIDELQAKAEAYIAAAAPIAAKIDRYIPRTIEGAIALIEDGTVEREERAIAGLREIAARGGVA